MDGPLFPYFLPEFETVLFGKLRAFLKLNNAKAYSLLPKRQMVKTAV